MPPLSEDAYIYIDSFSPDFVYLRQSAHLNRANGYPISKERALQVTPEADQLTEQ